MNCNEWQDLILDTLDGPLPPQLQEALDHHALDCQACCAFRAGQRQLDRFLTEAFPQPVLCPDFGARVLELADQEARGSFARPAARLPVPQGPEPQPTPTGARAWLWLDALAYAGVVLVGALLLNSLLAEVGLNWPKWQRQLPTSALSRGSWIWASLSVGAGLRLGRHRGARARLLNWLR